MNITTEEAAKLHERVPADWYFSSMKKNLGQKFWHETRFREVGKIIEPVSGAILDIGCADGVFSSVILSKSGAKKVIGIDVLSTSIKWAMKHWKNNHKLSFHVGNAHKLKYKSNAFSAVFALEVLEHVSDPVRVVKEIKRVLVPGGYAILLVPSDNILFKFIWFFWTKFWRGRIWDDCHIQSYAEDGLAKICRKQGLKIEVDHFFLLGMLNVLKVRKIK